MEAEITTSLNHIVKSTTRIIKKLGTHDQLLKEHDDPKAWAELVVKEMNEQVSAKKQDILVKFSSTAVHKQVQEFLGHEKASTTLDIYTHVSMEGKKDTAQAMDKLLA